MLLADLARAQADLPPPPPLPDGAVSVAILPIAATDVDPDLVYQLARDLVVEVDEVEGLVGVGPTDVANALEQYEVIPPSCAPQARVKLVSCIATAARYARAHQGMQVRMASVAGTLDLSVRLVDSVAGTELGRVAASVDPTDLRASLHLLMVQLLRPGAYVGDLTVLTEPGADVYIDDQLMGRTPLAGAIKGLAAGPHILRVSRPGFDDLWQFVDVVYRSNSTVRVDLVSSEITGLIVEEISTTGFGWLALNPLGEAPDDDLELWVDGEPTGRAPFAGKHFRLPAGTHRVSLYRDSQRVLAAQTEVIEKQRTDLALRLSPTDAPELAPVQVVFPDHTPPTPAQLDRALNSVDTPALALQAPPPPPPPTSKARLYTGIAAAGLGGAAVLTSAILARVIKGRNDTIDAYARESAGGGISQERYDAITADKERLDASTPTLVTAQWVSLGAGVVLLGGASALLFDELRRYFMHDDTPAITPTGDGVALSLHF